MTPTLERSLLLTFADGRPGWYLPRIVVEPAPSDSEGTLTYTLTLPLASPLYQGASADD